MNPTLDYLFHSGQLGIFVMVAWYLIKRLNRDESLKRDFPPHRHVNGSIIYPQEYEPGRVDKVMGMSAGK